MENEPGSQQRQAKDILLCYLGLCRNRTIQILAGTLNLSCIPFIFMTFTKINCHEKVDRCLLVTSQDKHNIHENESMQNDLVSATHER